MGTVIDFMSHRRTRAGYLDEALHLLSNHLPPATALWRSLPDIEVEYTDEGDWSLSLTSGCNTYLITPEDDTYRTYAVVRMCCDGVEVINSGASLRELLKVA